MIINELNNTTFGNLYPKVAKKIKPKRHVAPVLTQKLGELPAESARGVDSFKLEQRKDRLNPLGDFFTGFLNLFS